jgi:hypothetical protein
VALILFSELLIVLEQRKAVVLTTTAGVRLIALWKPKIGRWYMVAAGESGNERDNLGKVIDKLTPRQFQDAVDKGQYSFSW